MKMNCRKTSDLSHSSQKKRLVSLPSSIGVDKDSYKDAIEAAKNIGFNSEGSFCPSVDKFKEELLVAHISTGVQH